MYSHRTYPNATDPARHIPNITNNDDDEHRYEEGEGEVQGIDLISPWNAVKETSVIKAAWYTQVTRSWHKVDWMFMKRASQIFTGDRERNIQDTIQLIQKKHGDTIEMIQDEMNFVEEEVEKLEAANDHMNAILNLDMEDPLIVPIRHGKVPLNNVTKANVIDDDKSMKIRRHGTTSF